MEIGDRRDVFCYFVGMARLARIVAVNVAHHVTQRDNARQSILAADSERLVYLQLLRQYVELHGLSLLGYCLMSNHVHLVVVPRKAEALALALKQTHGEIGDREIGDRRNVFCYFVRNDTFSPYRWRVARRVAGIF